jgi:hypothetical protein
MQRSHNTEAVEQLDESELRITRFGKFIVFPPQPDYPKRYRDDGGGFSNVLSRSTQSRKSPIARTQFWQM